MPAYVPGLQDTAVIKLVHIPFRVRFNFGITLAYNLCMSQRHDLNRTPSHLRAKAAAWEWGALQVVCKLSACAAS